MHGNVTNGSSVIALKENEMIKKMQIAISTCNLHFWIPYTLL